jgi:hypothetical protein
MIIQRENRVRAPASIGRIELDAALAYIKKSPKTLDISVPTVNTYTRRVYEKLHVRSRGQVVAKYAHLPLADEQTKNPIRD